MSGTALLSISEGYIPYCGGTSLAESLSHITCNSSWVNYYHAFNKRINYTIEQKVGRLPIDRMVLASDSSDLNV